MRHRLSRAVQNTALALAVVSSTPLLAKEHKKPADAFAATYVKLANGGDTQTCFLHIDNYTPDAEAKTLAQLLADKGQIALKSEISKLKVGSIRLGGSGDYSIAVARSSKTATGRTVYLVANKPFKGVETKEGSGAFNYPFSVIILNLSKENKGDGEIIGAAQLDIDNDGEMSIRKYGSQVVRLLDIHPEK